MEQGDKDVDFTKQLQNKVRNWRKKLDNIKSKETLLKQGGELNETQLQLVNQKESLMHKLEETENILKMYQDYQAKKIREKQNPVNNQPLLEASKSLIELIHATYFLRYVQENQSELQQLFQSQEAQALLQFGNKILPLPSEGASYNNLLQSSLELTKDFVQKSSKQIPNTDLTYQQVHEFLSNVEKSLVQQSYPARHVKVEIREVIKEVQVQVPVPVVVPQQKQFEEAPVQQEQPQVQSQQEKQQKQVLQKSQQEKQQPEVKQVYEVEQEKDEWIQQTGQVENTSTKQKEVTQNKEEQKASNLSNSQKGKQFDEDGFQIVTQVKKPQKQKEPQRGEGGNRRRGGNFHQGRGKRGGFEKQQS